MSGKTVYYAIVREGDASENPAGLARRTVTADGQVDESLRSDLTWKPDSAISEWERGEKADVNLIEINEAEVEELTEHLREKWGMGE